MEEQTQSFEERPQNTSQNRTVVTMGDWIIALLVMCLPIVNVVMLFVWAFGSNTQESKSNWAKATLIFMLIGFVLGLLFWSTLMGLFLGSM